MEAAPIIIASAMANGFMPILPWPNCPGSVVSTRIRWEISSSLKATSDMSGASAFIGSRLDRLDRHRAPMECMGGPDQHAEDAQERQKYEKAKAPRRWLRGASFQFQPHLRGGIDLNGAAKSQDTPLLRDRRADGGGICDRRVLLLNQSFRQPHQGGILVAAI